MQVRGKLSYANVMSTLAVFLVLGGGVTIAAVSGSGKVRFGAERNLPSGQYETVLNLPGLGKLQAFCTGPGVLLELKNTSGKKLAATVVLEAADLFDSDTLKHKESLQATFTPPLDTARFRVFRPSNAGKPMADITASYKAGFSCSKQAVAAQALSSE